MALYEHIFLARQDLSQATLSSLGGLVLAPHKPHEFLGADEKTVVVCPLSKHTLFG